MADTLADSSLVSLDRMVAARDVIRGRLHHTPVMRSTYLSDRVGAPVHLKLELFQKTGSFKPRGVLNRLANMTDEERRRGLITLSAGNHAQAVAWAAREYGVRATVVMPMRATQAKVDATRGYGGDVLQTEGDLLATALELQRERDLTLVHPFDCPFVIAGQGTLGLEVVEQVPDVETVVVPVGGGGLIAGVVAAVKAERPNARVVGVEPSGAPKLTRARAAGHPVRLDSTNSIADGLMAVEIGHLTFAHHERFLDDVVTVDDAALRGAMRLLLDRMKLVVEPSGAITVAALLEGRVRPRGATVAVLSGGNIEWSGLRELLD